MLRIKDRDIKHALASLFVEILLPVAAVSLCLDRSFLLGEGGEGGDVSLLKMRDCDIKHALAGPFVEILLPVAAVSLCVCGWVIQPRGRGRGWESGKFCFIKN